MDVADGGVERDRDADADAPRSVAAPAAADGEGGGGTSVGTSTGTSADVAALLRQFEFLHPVAARIVIATWTATRHFSRAVHVTSRLAMDLVFPGSSADSTHADTRATLNAAFATAVTDLLQFLRASAAELAQSTVGSSTSQSEDQGGGVAGAASLMLLARLSSLLAEVPALVPPLTASQVESPSSLREPFHALSAQCSAAWCLWLRCELSGSLSVSLSQLPWRTSEDAWVAATATADVNVSMPGDDEGGGGAVAAERFSLPAGPTPAAVSLLASLAWHLSMAGVTAADDAGDTSGSSLTQLLSGGGTSVAASMERDEWGMPLQGYRAQSQSASSAAAAAGASCIVQ
jgi:hypothetical protein